MLLSLSQYLHEHHSDQEGLNQILEHLSLAAKIISKRTNKAGIDGIRGSHGGENTHGENQQKLDVFANDICKEYLHSSGEVVTVASEEEETSIHFPDRSGARYIVAFDPLDGSSNIDVNVSIGTIFSVHEKRNDVPLDSDEQFYQKGRDQVLAGYVLYGSSTVLTFTYGDAVHEFTLESEVGEFFLSIEAIKTPEEPKYYSVNEANYSIVADHDKAYIDHLRSLGLSGRYIGSFVADFHRNLLKGGVFMYPAVGTGRDGTFRGKLRLNYELKPMAWLQEVAGGLAISGKYAIMDILPTSLHERRAIVVGSNRLVSKYDQFCT